jgi:hypothetical protein
MALYTISQSFKGAQQKRATWIIRSFIEIECQLLGSGHES